MSQPNALKSNRVHQLLPSNRFVKVKLHSIVLFICLFWSVQLAFHGISLSFLYLFTSWGHNGFVWSLKDKMHNCVTALCFVAFGGFLFCFQPYYLL